MPFSKRTSAAIGQWYADEHIGVEQLELPQAVRFVFPHAPLQPVTINKATVEK